MWIYHIYTSLYGLDTFNDEIKALVVWQKYKNVPGSFYWKVEAVTGHWDNK